MSKNLKSKITEAVNKNIFTKILTLIVSLILCNIVVIMFIFMITDNSIQDIVSGYIKTVTMDKAMPKYLVLNLIAGYFIAKKLELFKAGHVNAEREDSLVFSTVIFTIQILAIITSIYYFFFRMGFDKRNGNIYFSLFTAVFFIYSYIFRKRIDFLFKYIKEKISKKSIQ